MSGVRTDSAWTGHAGWVGERERRPEETFTPDMAALVDGEDPGQSSDLEVAAMIMHQVFLHVFDGRKDANGKPRLDIAFRRFVCVAWLLRPELLDHMSLASLGTELGVTRAALSKMIRQFGDTHGIRNVFQKAEGARETYSQAQKRDHWRRRKAKEPVTPEGATGPLNGITEDETRHSEGSE